MEARTKQRSRHLASLQVLLLIGREERQQEVADYFGGEWRSGFGGEGSVDAQGDGRAGDEDDVGGSALEGNG